MDGNKLMGLNAPLSAFGVAAQQTRLRRLDLPSVDTGGALP